MSTSREYTTEEITKEFIDSIKQSIRYWDNMDTTSKEKLEGLAFSILTMLDGCSSLPMFIVAPDPHEDDKDYAIENEDDYYPQNHTADIKGNISGNLHNLFYK